MPRTSLLNKHQRERVRAEELERRKGLKHPQRDLLVSLQKGQLLRFAIQERLKMPHPLSREASGKLKAEFHKADGRNPGALEAKIAELFGPEVLKRRPR